ncbi:MAG: hypothetical protein IPH37_09870 [Burkholderiales bacterium]|jgi:hypothetical protein|nr:hypothetical protein [Burkholderiales bacterium]MBK9346561.1 hypothetical protein [Burkholderiales bacterium]
MFSGFFGKDNKSAKPPAKDAVDSRGLEVIEDDPDTTWGLWDSALADQESRFNAAAAAGEPAMRAGVPTVRPDFDAATQPMPLQDMSPAQRRDAALNVVEMHHSRIAQTIRSMWGYKECSTYISKLIMDGADVKGANRMGFNQEAAEAMMVLATLHDAEFGASDDSTGTGFGGLSPRTGWDALR